MSASGNGAMVLGTVAMSMALGGGHHRGLLCTSVDLRVGLVSDGIVLARTRPFDLGRQDDSGSSFRISSIVN